MPREKAKVAGPALLPLGSFAQKGVDRERYATPFPRCHTTEEILGCQEQARAVGLTIISWEQRPLTLRAPEPGEEGAIVAESADDQPTSKQVFSAKTAATGARGSRLWVVSDEYPLLGSTAALRQHDYEQIALRGGKPRQLPASGRKPPSKPQLPAGATRQIAIWRLIAHHAEGERVVQWSRQKSAISIGYGGVGDLTRQQFADAPELTQVLAFYHPDSSMSNVVNGGRSLWRLFHEMEIGDLVILRTGAGGGRPLTMRVTGDYYFVENDQEQDYEHRRKAEAVSIDAGKLWELSGGAASGESPRWTLIRCANTLSEAEYRALLVSK